MEPIGEFLAMLDTRTTREVQNFLQKDRAYAALMLSLAGVGLAFTLGAFFVLHRRVIIPVRKLVVAAEAVEGGQYGQRVEHASSDELGELACAFNDMTSAIQRDIAERERVEEELRRREPELRQLIDASPVATIIAHMEGDRPRAEFYNRKLEDVFGYTLEEAPTFEAWAELAYPDPAYRREIVTRFESAVAEANRTRSEMKPLESRVRCKSGEERYVELIATSLGEKLIFVLNDLTDRKEAEQLIARRSLENSLLHRVGEIVAETASFEDALQRVVDLICELTGWPVGHVYRPSAQHREVLDPTTIWHVDDPAAYAVFREVTERTSFRIGEGLPGRILASGDPAWISNVQSDTNFPRNRLASDLGVKGAFGFPVKVRGEIVAILEFFANEEIIPDESMIKIIRHVGDQLSRVLERKRAAEELQKANERMKRDLDAAAEVQRDLLPKELPETIGANFAWTYEPCDELGGDILNVLPLNADNVAMYLLDVSGHGVPAALLSVTISRVMTTSDPGSSILINQATNSAVTAVAPPRELVGHLNRQFPMTGRQYFTMAYAVLNTKTRVLRYALAGHPAPVLVRRNCLPRQLTGRNLPIGIFEDAEFEDCSIQLEPGDRLYFYSDGITEAINADGSMLNPEGYIKFLAAAQTVALDKGLIKCMDDLKRWSGSTVFSDDISVLALEIPD